MMRILWLLLLLCLNVSTGYAGRIRGTLKNALMTLTDYHVMALCGCECSTNYDKEKKVSNTVCSFIGYGGKNCTVAAGKALKLLKTFNMANDNTHIRNCTGSFDDSPS